MRERAAALDVRLRSLGGLNWGGALSDLVRVPFADHMLVQLPAEAIRLALATELGAEPIEGVPSEPIGPYEVTVDASADPQKLATALRSTAPCGTCTSIGIYWENDVPLPLLEMYDRAITFIMGSPQAVHTKLVMVNA